jgi:hypothetical protein
MKGARGLENPWLKVAHTVVALLIHGELKNGPLLTATLQYKTVNNE